MKRHLLRELPVHVEWRGLRAWGLRRRQAYSLVSFLARSKGQQPKEGRRSVERASAWPVATSPEVSEQARPASRYPVRTRDLTKNRLPSRNPSRSKPKPSTRNRAKADCQTCQFLADDSCRQRSHGRHSSPARGRPKGILGESAGEAPYRYWQPSAKPPRCGRQCLMTTCDLMRLVVLSVP